MRSDFHVYTYTGISFHFSLFCFDKLYSKLIGGKPQLCTFLTAYDRSQVHPSFKN